MNLTLESLGLSQEEIQERVVERVADQLTRSLSSDDQGDAHERASQFYRAMQERVKTAIDEKVEALAERELLPRLRAHVDEMLLQETTTWGEKVGKPLSVVEYIVARAEHYLTEKVSSQGKSKGQDSYNWRGSQTRVTYLVDSHLQYHIEKAMKAAMVNANNAIVGGIEEAVKTKLAEVAAKLTVQVATKR